jgi:hypothetical protein
MQINLTADDVIGEMKKRLSDAEHELMLQKLMNQKLLDEINKFESAAAERNAASPARRLSAAKEELPVQVDQTPENSA